MSNKIDYTDTAEMPDDLKAFIEKSKWIFAKTYETTWPHTYIVRYTSDIALFEKLVQFITDNGFKAMFYKKKGIYLNYNGNTYWTMTGCPKFSKIINRCDIDDTYENRLKRGKELPEQRSTKKTTTKKS